MPDDSRRRRKSRPLRLNVLLATDERQMLETASEATGLSLSDVVRMLIHREYGHLRKPIASPTP